MKTITMRSELKKIEKRVSLEDQVMKIVDKIPMTASEIVRHLHSKSSNIRGLLSNMVRDGRLKIVICPHCEIGRMYKVKNNVP